MRILFALILVLGVGTTLTSGPALAFPSPGTGVEGESTDSKHEDWVE